MKPGCVNTTEIDIRKVHARYKPKISAPSYSGMYSQEYTVPIIINAEVSSQSYFEYSMDTLKKEITTLKIRLERRNIKLSKIAET